MPDLVKWERESPAVLLITGSGRSGSTLVERALGAINGFVNVGELTDLPRRVVLHDECCGCGRPFSVCPFWTEVGGLAFGGWSQDLLTEVQELRRRVVRQRNFPAMLMGRDPDLVSGLLEYAAFYHRLYSAIAAVSGARYVVDASKLPAHALALTYSPLRLLALHVIRDPRGVAYSMGKSGVLRPHARGSQDLMWRAGPAMTALRWAVTQTESSAVGRRLAASARLRYEDFVRDPAEEIRRVLVELGAPRDVPLSHVEGAHLDLRASHGLSGNPSRFREGRITLHNDDRWEQEMPFGRRLLVDTATAPVRAALRLDRPAPSFARPPAKPAPSPLVSAVVVTHGRPELVRQAVAAVVHQDYAGDIECLVVHDRETVDRGLEALSRPARTVRVLANGHQPGLAGARNTGVEAASGSFVATCDDDDLWYTDKIRRQMELLTQEPTLLLVGSGIRLLLPSGRSQVWPGRHPVIPRDLLLRNRVKELHSSTLLVRRDAYAKAGLYDEGLPYGYGEDYDWILRVARVGRIGVVQAPLAMIDKAGTSYFTRPARVLSGLEGMAARHPEILRSRRGRARMLGQMSYAHVVMGQRKEGLRTACVAACSWPLSPYPYVTLLQLALGAHSPGARGLARALGRGVV